MSQLNDCRLAALIAGGYGDQHNDALLAWAQANGATSNQLNDALLEAAQANGATANDLNDAMFEVLGLLGYTGSLNDRQLDFWCIGGGVLGFRAESATMGGTNFQVVVTFSGVPQNYDPITGVQITVDGVDELNSGVAPLLIGNTLTYTLNYTAASVDEVRWIYAQPPGLISDGTSLAPSTNLQAQAQINPVFHVPLTSSLIPVRASDFNYTFSGSPNRTVTDFEGLVKDVTANEARFVGARRVENLATGLVTQVIAVENGAEYQLTIAGTNASTAVCSGSFTGTLTADGTNRISWPSGTPKTSVGISVVITVSGTLTEMLFEDVTGQAIQNPSENVDIGAEHGTNAGNVKYFPYENGNTVSVGGVVTEAPGADIPDATLEGVLVEEPRPNYANTDDDLTGGAETVDITAGGTGDYTLSVFGSAAVTVAAGTATGSGFAQATEGSPVTFNITVVGTITLTLNSGTLDASQSGDFLKQVETGSFPTSFIPSPTTTAATRTSENLSYSNVNISNTEGTFAVRCTFAGSTAQYTGDGDRAIISIRGVGQDMIHIANATGKVVLDDNTGTTSTTALPAIVAGGLTKLSSRWKATDLLMTMGQEFVESEVAFDGSMGKLTPIFIGGLSRGPNGSYKDVRGWPLAYENLPYEIQPSP
jgi:hypothetical protein